MSDNVVTDSLGESPEGEAARRRTFTRNKWLFSLGGIGRDMTYTLIASFLMIYIQFGVSLTLVQFTTISLVIGVGGRIWDAVNDPMMGAIIEGTHMKFGKFKPWILFGALGSALVIIAMFNVQSLAGWSFVAFMIIMYLLWESTFTMNDIGYWAMLPSLSSVTRERDSVTMLTVLFAGVGSIIAQGLISPLTVGDMRAGYRVVSILFAGALVVCQAMTAFGVRETPRPKNEKHEKISIRKMWQTIRNNDQILWMTLSQLFYNIGSTLLTALVANLIYSEISYNGTLYFYVVVAFGLTTVAANILYPLLAAKLGRKRLQAVAITMSCVAYAVMGLLGWSNLLPLNMVLLCTTAVFIAAGQSLFYMASIVNMTNCVEYNAYKQGERNEAVVSTLRPFMAKFAGAIQILIVTVVLALSGVYTLSRSISTLETQRDFFNKLQSTEEQVYYVSNVQEYISILSEAQPQSEEYTAAVSRVNDMINSDSVMMHYQMDAEHISAMGEAVLLRGGDELGRLKDISAQTLTEGGPCTLEVGDVKAGDSAANISFRDKITTPMRVWLRVATTALPIILLVTSLIIQRRKFIIDEKYYEMMLKELAKRDAAN